MDRKPLPAGVSRSGRRRHPAARSRVVAGVMSALLFLGLGAGMAADRADVLDTDSSASGAAGGTASGGSSWQSGADSGSWAASEGSSSVQEPMTSSQGS